MNDWLCDDTCKYALAVLPEGHGRARLHAVVRVAPMHEGLVQHQLGLGECSIDFAVGPLLGWLAHGHALAGIGEIVTRPLQRLEVHARRANVAVGARIGLVRVQAGQRIDSETAAARSRCVIFSSASCAVVSSSAASSKYRRAHIPWLVGEQLDFRCRRILHIVCGEYAHHTGHGQRLRGIDVLHACVRIGAGQQPREHHALDAEILGVLGLASDLGHHVVRQEVLAQVLIRHGGSPPCCRPRA